MTISMLTNGDGTFAIKGDEQLFEKLPEGFDVLQVDISDEKIDAHNLAIAANHAEYRGVEAIKRYFAIKAAFERQQALVTEQANQPKISHPPAITSQSIKPVDA
ncbi:hypothetical protein ABE61_22665 [Lysinibacillus sphaericus]|uniref:hypothetical protein n=1 Tax=Lysinibacillus sphaericus TaxID=1421 RepID=UPI0018CCD4BB|nr:hypothetical protein [Lysinibacillus sphaericus]MBG9456736.1 hypothetical protein [Lysinibacillus sphaericus]MBG9476900.1 hypothetical protein [Lysinibacillus sphaericus]MBG9591449.1 hypothetical protein [Lysinibacillus sphaericus]